MCLSPLCPLSGIDQRPLLYDHALIVVSTECDDVVESGQLKGLPDNTQTQERERGMREERRSNDYNRSSMKSSE